MKLFPWSRQSRNATSHQMLEAKDLCLVRSGRKILDQVSLRLPPGELVALVGPNGAGKTTLVEALIGRSKPSAGEVLLGGHPLDSYSADERARQVALLGRESSIHQSLMAKDVVALGRIAHRQAWGLLPIDTQLIEDAMKRTRCLEFAHRAIHSLSDGEQQRVHWARALAQQTGTLLLDEATAHLDIAGKERSFATARVFTKEGGAVLAVAHELDLAVRYADRILVLQRGRIVSDGAPKDTFSPQLLADVFGVHAAVKQDNGQLQLMIFGTIE